MILYLKTRLLFDAATLQHEFTGLQKSNWQAHYNKSHYEGDWSSIALRSINGDVENTISLHTLPPGLSYSDTPLLEQCPYIQSLLSSFQCEKTSVRLMKLNAGALIKEHTDQEMYMEAGEARFHIPVQTNKDVAFFIMEDRIPMLAGECWYLNLSLPHKVHNAGDEDRIHLVIDCVVNDWVRKLLNEQDTERKDMDEMPGQAIKNEDKAKIISELRSLNTPAALQLLSQLEAQ